MRKIGTITFTQIQQEPLKTGERPHRVYRTQPILKVPRLRLTRSGVFGLTEDDKAIIDVHHIDHPRTRNRGNANGISFNFQPNYARIRAHFPDRPADTLADGIGGENITIAPEAGFDMSQLGSEVFIQPTNTATPIHLHDVMVAAPCTEYSCFLAGETIGGERLRNTLEFLADGTRGFYATMALAQPEVIIGTGDAVYVP